MTPAPTARLRARFTATAGLALAAAAGCDTAVEPPPPTVFQVPIAGERGVDWFYGPLPNHNNQPDQAEDYLCGTKTIEFRQTTDFLIPTFVEMEAGVDVLAAADGDVIRVTDGHPDRHLSYSFGREGNSIRVRHPDGIESRYRFLKQGSIQVRVGDRVEAGQAIAEVGSSGDSNWPRLGFEARNTRGDAFDPWAGACSGARSFWVEQPDYPNDFIVVDFATTDVPLTLFNVAYRPPTVTDFLPGQGVGFWVHTVNRPVGELTFRLLGPESTLDSAGISYTEPDPANTVFGGVIILGSNAPLGDWAVEYFMNGTSFARMDFTVAGHPVTASSAWTRPDDDVSPPTSPMHGGVVDVQVGDWGLDGLKGRRN